MMRVAVGAVAVGLSLTGASLFLLLAALATATAAAAFPNGDDGDKGNNNDGSKGVITVPLLPHREVLARRRRERRLLLGGGTLDADAEEEHDDDIIAARSPVAAGYPRRRRRIAEGGGEGDEGEGQREEISSLYQGYGTHYCDLWVGTPPQRQTVIIDTGSGVTAFPCHSCYDCGAGMHTDAPFVESDSVTFEYAGCDHCVMGPCGSTGHGADKCILTMRYAEGSSWKAVEARDVCYVGGLHDQALLDQQRTAEAEEGSQQQQLNEEAVADFNGADPRDAPAFSFRLRFGCQTAMTGLFKTQLADGIAGMEDSATSLWAQMYYAGAIHSRVFSLCFLRQERADIAGTRAGALTLGGTDGRLHDTPMMYAQMMGNQGFYTVYVTNVWLRAGGGGTSAGVEPGQKVLRVNVDRNVMNSGGIIVDSGTTDTYLPKNLRQPFADAWREATGGADMPGDRPVQLGIDQLDRLPTILFQLRAASHILPEDAQADAAAAGSNASLPGLVGNLDPKNPHDVLVAFPPRHYMLHTGNGNGGEYELRLHFTEGSGEGGVLGANVLLGHDVTFDMENGRIGFAESRCDYDGVAGGEAAPTR